MAKLLNPQEPFISIICKNVLLDVCRGALPNMFTVVIVNEVKICTKSSKGRTIVLIVFFGRGGGESNFFRADKQLFSVPLFLVTSQWPWLVV